MSLIPHSLFYNDWWDDHPLDLFDQAFGLPASERQLPSYLQFRRPYWMLPGRVSGQANESNTSRVVNDKDKFAVNLDVHHFKPEELKVSKVDDTICIEGAHEEKSDEHGMISRQFVRKYKLPKDVDVKQLTSNLTNQGVLTIQAPKLAIQGDQTRDIPIRFGESKPQVQEITKTEETNDR